MNQLQKLSMSIIMGVGLYFLLTLPHFIAFFTMDIDTGHYHGYVYPIWLIMLIAAVSGPLGVLIVNKLEKKS
jgi:general stress protein CsbA